MGSIREKDNSFSIPLAYAMYYVWGTRMLTGSYSYEFAVLPFKGNWKEADLHRKALEYSFLVPTIETEPKEGKLGAKVMTFALDAENDVILTSLYPMKDKIVARFYKSGDQTPETFVQFEKRGAKMTQINLDGKFIKESKGKVGFTPWEIKTFQIQGKHP
jgi:alpha-mannosidase